MRLDRQLFIYAPEHSRFQLPVAGVASRFFAVMIDFLCLCLMLFVLQVLMGLLRVPMMMLSVDITVSFLSALSMLLVFVLQWGYFVLFEWVWGGQTPGKRTMGIRVVQRDGAPITWFQSAVRNLFRIVDALPMMIPILYPFGYLVGLVVIWLDSENRRLGDLASGTVVIREARYQAPDQILSSSSNYYNSFRQDVALRRRFQQLLEKSEKELLLDLSLRAERLELGVRFPMMQKLSAFLEERLRLVRPEFMSEEKFVLNVADALVAEEEWVGRRLREKQG